MALAIPKIHMPLDPALFGLLADTLGDKPETVIPVHCLRHGLCKAHLAGDPDDFKAAVIQVDPLPDEPDGFGDDPHLIWHLLKELTGWTCVFIHGDCASELAHLITQETGVPARLYGGPYFALTKSVAIFRHNDVRSLAKEDINLLKSAPEQLRGAGFESTEALLADGIVACAVIDGEIVAIAHVAAFTDRHAEIGVHTNKEHRCRGYSTAAASIVAGEIQEAGRIPVWSTGEDNIPSLRVAEKLGFQEVSRKFYVIPGRGPEMLRWDGSGFSR